MQYNSKKFGKLLINNYNRQHNAATGAEVFCHYSTPKVMRKGPAANTQ